MRKLFLTTGAAALLMACGTSKTATTTKAPEVKPKQDVSFFANTITSDELKEALYTYASDDFEGRDTGEPGQKKAVEYLKNHYVTLGIPSPISEGDYFQKVPLEKQAAPDMTLKIGDKEFKAIEDYVSVTDGENGEVNSQEIAYVGYGIDSENYSSYKDIDVAGKFVLIKGGEPKNEDGTFIISGSDKASKWSTNQQYRAKREIALSKGAKGILFYSPQIYPMVAQQFGSGGQMGLKEDTPQEKMYYIFVNSSIAKAVVEEIDSETTSKLIKTPMNLTFKSNVKEVDSENVAAFIKGSEKPDEIIVISAHLDHEGVKGGAIYNGADDDGSGTVAILEIAEAFKAAVDNGQTPKRSILFLHVTGEEKGLLGSQYYTDKDPIFPLENTVANLNIDMIGRTDPQRTEGDRNYVYLIGSDKLSTELHNLSEEVNKKCCNVELDYKFNDDNDPNRFYYRSDHYNFAKNNIPVIFYFNGTHADYHQPSDTPDKIEYDLLENRTRLIFNTAWELANRDARIIVDKAEVKAE
ncbi:MAG: M28 family peptidase [Flavobacteriaceae bacterium]|nr:M28 family peptidase [Flavobacteriaceae bacterium]